MCVILAPLEAANGIALLFFEQPNQWLEFKVELTVCWSNDSFWFGQTIRIGIIYFGSEMP